MILNSKIKIKRGEVVEESRNLALIRLNSIKHDRGVPILINYKDDNKTGTMFAIGIKSGVGKDCYKIISSGLYEVVSDIVFQIPDVSYLIHGEVYLYNNGVRWYFVSFDQETSSRVLTSVPDSHHVFLNLKDNSIWLGTGSSNIYPVSDLREKIDIIGNIESIEDLSSLIDDVRRVEQRIDILQSASNNWEDQFIWSNTVDWNSQDNYWGT